MFKPRKASCTYFKTNIYLKIFSSDRMKGQRTAVSFNKDKDWIKQVLVLKLRCFDNEWPKLFSCLATGVSIWQWQLCLIDNCMSKQKQWHIKSPHYQRIFWRNENVVWPIKCSVKKVVWSWLDRQWQLCMSHFSWIYTVCRLNYFV